MPHRQTLVLLARSADQLTCYVETGSGCSAGCFGCSQSATPNRSFSEQGRWDLDEARVEKGQLEKRQQDKPLNTQLIDNSRKVRLPARLLARSDSQVGPGGTFELEMRGEMLIVLSSLVYLSPVLLMLLFCVCCSVLFPGRESWVLGSAVAGLGTGMAAVYFCGDMIRQKLLHHLNVHSKA